MKISKIFLTAAISAGIATTIIAAVCTVNHQYPCSHQKASGNKGSCVDGYVVLCESQTSSNICNNITNAIEVVQDFPTSCEDCSSATNYFGILAYSEHYNCNTPDKPCYRSVLCVWNEQLHRCVPYPNEESIWYSKQKRVTENCN